MTWSKGIVHWAEDGAAFLSVPFTWELPRAYSLAVWYRGLGCRVRAGGPAVSLMPQHLAPVAELGGGVDALPRHNPQATFTSRGCPRQCRFCAVPLVEGDLVELEDWEPKPIVCDNNLLACSRRHFDRVVDRLKPLKGVDFNQGLDARLLSSHHIARLGELNLHVVRLAWDDVRMEAKVLDAIGRLLAAGMPKGKVRVYVLVGFHDAPDDALYRCQTLKDMGILPNPQRYNPLDTLRKDSYLPPNWTARQLADFIRYWSRQKWFRPIPFAEYNTGHRKKRT